MPKVVRQTAGPKRRQKVVRKKAAGSHDLRDQMCEIGEEEGGIKLNIYGRAKTGKTRLACTFPRRLMLIGAAGYGTEKGTRSLGRIKQGKFVALEHTEQIPELAKIAIEDEYKTVALDTAGGVQERVVNEFLDQDPSVKRDWGIVPKGEWGAINMKTMERLRCFLDLADFHNINVVIIAHERSFNVESESSLVLPWVGSALTPGVAGWLDGACDYIGQTFIREATEKKTVRIAGKPKQVVRGTGRSEYCFRIGPDPVYKTGFRVPPGTQLPDVIVNPDYNKLLAIIQGG